MHLHCYFGGRLSLGLLVSLSQSLRDSMLFTHNSAALPLDSRSYQTWLFPAVFRSRQLLCPNLPASPLERIASRHTPPRAPGLLSKCLGECGLTETDSHAWGLIRPGLFHTFIRFANLFSSPVGPELRKIVKDNKKHIH